MEIGKRVRVENIKNVWGQETAFTTWLATPDGLDLIVQDLGIEIEDARTEWHSEDFRCDVVGHLAGDEGHRIVIEAQFGKTDHNHRGKLLTYASVHRATTGIWITERASGDHRQVIDWLNANTPDTVNLYLCELRAYRIGESAVAPQLDVVCRPNFEIKPHAPGNSEEENVRDAWRRAFWTEINAHLDTLDPNFHRPKPGTSLWAPISIGRANFSLNMLVKTGLKRIGVELYMQPKGWKQNAFEQLLARRAAIESEVGETLDWQPMPENLSARIILEKPLDPNLSENREAIIAWFGEIVPKMHAAFKPRVAALVVPVGTSDDGE